MTQAVCRVPVDTIQLLGLGLGGRSACGQRNPAGMAISVATDRTLGGGRASSHQPVAARKPLLARFAAEVESDVNRDVEMAFEAVMDGWRGTKRGRGRLVMPTSAGGIAACATLFVIVVLVMMFGLYELGASPPPRSRKKG